MSTMNIFVGNLQLPPFPAGQPASEVYKTLKDAYGGGILVGPNGVGILNNNSLVPPGNYTYVPASAVVPRVGVAPYASARVGPYATFTYATSAGGTPQGSGVAPVASTISPLPSAGTVLASGAIVQSPSSISHGHGGPPNSTGRSSPHSTLRLSPRGNARVAPRTPESHVPPNAEGSRLHEGGTQEQMVDGHSPAPLQSRPVGGSLSRAMAARGKLPDWSPQELKKLILAKKQEWEHATCGTPLQKKMASGKEKWKIIAEHLMNEGMKNPIRDHSSCKKKWEKVTGEFKKVYDYERIACGSDESYYSITAVERRSKNLPSNFSEEVYNLIVGWLPSKHEVDPTSLHVLDTSTRRLDHESPGTESKPGRLAESSSLSL